MWAVGLHPTALLLFPPPTTDNRQFCLTAPGRASSLGGMSEQISPTIRIGAGLPVLPPPSGV